MTIDQEETDKEDQGKRIVVLVADARRCCSKEGFSIQTIDVSTLLDRLAKVSWAVLCSKRIRR